MRVWASVVEALERHDYCALVSVADSRGSTPRETGARLVVGPDGSFRGTIGGGELEWQAIANARTALRTERASVNLSQFTLGPDLGQCCGGTVRLLTEVLDASRIDEARAFAACERDGAFATSGQIGDNSVQRTLLDIKSDDQALSVQAQDEIVLEGESRIVERFAPAPRTLLLFGAGHVGRALMLALAPLPFSLRWIDQRESAFPSAVAANVTTIHSTEPTAALNDAPDHAFILVMTHNHALDLDIVHAALGANRFAYVGLIGSKSKRARFLKRLRDANVSETQLDALVCPIGIGDIRSKLPAAIAAAVAVELLARDEACSRSMALASAT